MSLSSARIQNNSRLAELLTPIMDIYPKGIFFVCTLTVSIAFQLRLMPATQEGIH